LVDLFGGSGAVVLNSPYPNNVYNDLDVNLFVFFNELKRYPDFIIKSLERGFNHYNGDLYKIWQDRNIKTVNPTEVAVQTFIKYRLSMSGCGKSFSKTTRLRRGMNELESKWLSSIAAFPALSKRLQACEIKNLSYDAAIALYDSPTTFFYEDPPYLASTRVAKKVYNHEFTEQDHKNLADINKNIQGKFLLSAYNSTLYKDLYKSWCYQGMISTKAHSSTKSKKPKRIEVAWRNYI